MKAKKVTSQKLMVMAKASVARFGAYLGINNPIILKFSNAKSYYGKYETELVVADTIAIVHVITISAFHNATQEIMDSTMAHEMVHAVQIENGTEADHGDNFQLARSNIMRDFGVDIDETF